MDYFELTFKFLHQGTGKKQPLIDDLAQIGFDTFEETKTGFKAYILSDSFDEKALKQSFLRYKERYSYSVNLIPAQNWNQIWENDAEPVSIANKLFIRNMKHESRSDVSLNVIIEPKMAFGTGHHETTYLMCEYLLQTELGGKTVLDVGCGTGILSIVASLCGANEVTALDINKTCIASTTNNCTINQISNVRVYQENITTVKGSFDVILANINRATLIEHLPCYVNLLTEEGELYLSGFYEDPDLSILQERVAFFGLKYISHHTKNKWTAAKFIK